MGVDKVYWYALTGGYELGEAQTSWGMEQGSRLVLKYPDGKIKLLEQAFAGLKGYLTGSIDWYSDPNWLVIDAIKQEPEDKSLKRIFMEHGGELFWIEIGPRKKLRR